MTSKDAFPTVFYKGKQLVVRVLCFILNNSVFLLSLGFNRLCLEEEPVAETFKEVSVQKTI